MACSRSPGGDTYPYCRSASAIMQKFYVDRIEHCAYSSPLPISSGSRDIRCLSTMRQRVPVWSQFAPPRGLRFGSGRSPSASVTPATSICLARGTSIHTYIAVSSLPVLLEKITLLITDTRDSRHRSYSRLFNVTAARKSNCRPLLSGTSTA